MIRGSFDALVASLADSATTLSERELLQPSHWSLGEDARLREDLRFKVSPWGRWMLAENLVVNDAIYGWLHAERRSSVPLETALKRAADLLRRRCTFCAADPRFVLRDDLVHLAASELSRQPVVEDEVGDLEKYTTHLPLHSLKAAAASEPAGEWGPIAHEQAIETLGWISVTLPGRRLNDRMFIAEIEGQSMDDGKSGLMDGSYAVFELWPSGTKQAQNVLVRGAFRDPETGSYAVKKYVADQRDAEGRHNKVSLVSLNPDKERYPDIELQPEQDDDLTVVAKVVQALSTDDYERRPKPMRRAGRRNLTGHEGLDEQSSKLGRRIASFFDGVALDDEDEDTNETADTGWQARLVCLDVEAGGLHLELCPLEGLPPFVKKLRIVGGGAERIVLAANARTMQTRVAVAPNAGPWHWEAVGFEDEQDLGLEQLAYAELASSGPIVFRVDAQGVGQLTQSMTLALGQSYRLLLPPHTGTANLGTELVAGPGGGWRLWSLDLAAQPSLHTRETLTSIGLNVGDARPRLTWALEPATAWRTNVRGETYPLFESGTELFVDVSGVSVDEGESMMLFVHGPACTERLAMSANGLVSLGAPTTGRWACALMHSRTSVPTETLLFEVECYASNHVDAAWTVAAPKGLASLEVKAPPGWPIAFRWKVLSEQNLATLYADDDGTVELDNVHALIESRARRTRLADLVVDVGELGRHRVAHERRASVQDVRKELTDLWRQRAGLVQSRVGAWLQLLPAWFEPVTTLLGYALEPLPEDALSTKENETALGLAAWRLTVDERTTDEIVRAPSRVLVLTTEVDAALRDHRAWIDSACVAAKVREAIVTDGIRWTTHRKGDRQLKQRAWDLDAAIDIGNVDDMLNDLAEGM